MASERNEARPPHGAGDDDPSIPVLTERLTLPPLDIDFTLPPQLTALTQPPRVEPDPAEPAVAAAEPAVATAVQPVITPAAATAEPPWRQLEQDLRESVLRELSARLPQNVEQIVRDKMQPGIQAAIDRLAYETRVAIAASLRDIVDRAVKAELERMKAQRQL